MSTTTYARSRALADVCALVTQAEAQGQISIPVAALRVALDPVEVEHLAAPGDWDRVCNVGGSRDAAPFNSPG